MSLVAILRERCQLRPAFGKLARRKTQEGTKKWAFHRHSTEDIYSRSPKVKYNAIYRAILPKQIRSEPGQDYIQLPYFRK